MRDEIFPSSCECDCGYVAQFSEDSVKAAKERSLGKKQWLSKRTPGLPRSITVVVPAEELPRLESA